MNAVFNGSGFQGPGFKGSEAHWFQNNPEG